jgi:hypothetical protein
VVAGRGPGVLGDDVLAPALSVTADVGDFIADLAAAGFRENFHKVLFAVLAAGRVAGPLALVGLDATGSWTPVLYD